MRSLLPLLTLVRGRGGIEALTGTVSFSDTTIMSKTGCNGGIYASNTIPSVHIASNHGQSVICRPPQLAGRSGKTGAQGERDSR
jgi:hypothetical protein